MEIQVKWIQVDICKGKNVKEWKKTELSGGGSRKRKESGKIVKSLNRWKKIEDLKNSEKKVK